MRKKTYNFQKSKEIVKKYFKTNKQSDNDAVKTETAAGCCEKVETEEFADENDSSEKRAGFSLDYDVIKERPSEKRQVDFREKLILSPLTTVGNLPFRRICKEFGADITCGKLNLVESNQSLID